MIRTARGCRLTRRSSIPGQLAGLLEVDYTIDEFLHAVEARARTLVLVSLIGLLLATVVSVMLAHSVGRALP